MFNPELLGQPPQTAIYVYRKFGVYAGPGAVPLDPIRENKHTHALIRGLQLWWRPNSGRKRFAEAGPKKQKSNSWNFLPRKCDRPRMTNLFVNFRKNNRLHLEMLLNLLLPPKRSHQCIDFGKSKCNRASAFNFQQNLTFFCKVYGLSLTPDFSS